MTPRQPLESLLGPLVHVEQPKLEVQDGLAGHAEPEVPGLDDAGVNGSHGHLEHTLAGHGPERMEVAGHSRHRLVAWKILSQRPRALGPVVVQRHALGLGCPSGVRPKKSMTSRSNQFAAGYFAAIDGRRGRVVSDGGRHAKEDAQARQRPDMVHDEAARRTALVGGEERHQPRPQAEHGAGRQRRQLRCRHVEEEFSRAQLAHGAIRHAERLRHDRRGFAHAPPHTTCVAARISAISGAGR